MPTKVLSCTVEIDIRAVSSPGTRLTKFEDIWVSVRLFGQNKRTRLVAPFFPLVIYDKLHFNKVFYTAYEPSQVAEALEDSMVRIELIQDSDVFPSGRLLAWYDSSARRFLYPSPSYLPPYGLHDREVLMERSTFFPGISPKLEFSTRTVIREVMTPVLDTADLKEDFVNGCSGRLSRRRSRSRSIERPTVSSAYRSRSLSPRKHTRSVSPALYSRLQGLNLEGGEEAYDNRPPFVVRKVNSFNPNYALKRRTHSVDDDLIHRKITGDATLGLDKLPIERGRQRTLQSSANGSNGVTRHYGKGNTQNGVDLYIDQESGDSADDVDDDDIDYAALELESDFLLRERIRQALRRSRHRQRLSRLLEYQRHLRSTLYRESMDDLELDLELARLRRYYSLYP